MKQKLSLRALKQSCMSHNKQRAERHTVMMLMGNGSIDRCKASSSGNCKVVVVLWECSLSNKHNWKAGAEKLLCHFFFPLVPLRMKGHKILQYEQSKYSYSRESWTQFSCRIGHKKTLFYFYNHINSDRRKKKKSQCTFQHHKKPFPLIS